MYGDILTLKFFWKTARNCIFTYCVFSAFLCDLKVTSLTAYSVVMFQQQMEHMKFKG